MRPLAITLAALLAAGPAAAAPVAVPPTIEPSASQDDALRRGTEAYRKEEYAAAVEAYDEALAIGLLNIALLNKGRALQRLGDCNGAADAYVRVLDAPAVTEPSPDTVRGALTRYQAQLAAECPGTLVVTCDPPGAKLQFADIGPGPEDTTEGLPRIGCGTLVELPPGPYTIIARAHGQVERHRITIVGVQTHTLDIQIAPIREVDPGVSTLTIAGWASLGVATVALGAGIFASLQVDAIDDEAARLAAANTVQRNDIEDALEEATLYEALQWSSYALAAVSLGLGLWMLDEGGDAPRLTPAAGRGRAGAILTIPF